MAIAQQTQQPSRRDPGKPKKPRFAHTANTKYGMGDNYGTGVKAKLGTMREGPGMVKLSKKKIGTPPKSVV
jgi:hypothetical protein